MDRLKLQLEKERGLRVSLEMELLKIQTGMHVSSDVNGRVSIIQIINLFLLVYLFSNVYLFIFNLEDEESGGYACF